MTQQKAERYLVAVSGGVDSVVLLDMLAKSVPASRLFVAHFDHGTRGDSAADARFVRQLALHYSLPFFTTREELGSGVSEDRARTRRYLFLRSTAKKLDATLVTAHHADDCIESIIINMQRGTGWRGLAVLAAPDIKRPLIATSKKELYAYALQHKLEWVEDATNATDYYLRNRVRRQMGQLKNVQKQAVLRLWSEQKALKQAIDKEASRFVSATNSYDRYFFIMLPQQVAAELFRAAVKQKTGTSPTLPQTRRALIAIRVAKPGAAHEVGAMVTLRFKKRFFVVETP